MWWKRGAAIRLWPSLQLQQRPLFDKDSLLYLITFQRGSKRPKRWQRSPCWRRRFSGATLAQRPSARAAPPVLGGDLWNLGRSQRATCPWVPHLPKNTKYQVSGTWYLVLQSYLSLPHSPKSAKYQVSGTWYLVLPKRPITWTMKGHPLANLLPKFLQCSKFDSSFPSSSSLLDMI